MRYYLSLVLIDEGMFTHMRRNLSVANLRAVDARRYFKQSEIVLFRQAPEGLAAAQAQNQQIAVS